MLTFPVTFFKSGVVAATYLLRTLFSGVSGPWTNAQVLDTAAEGVTDGVRTVVETGSGSLTVSNSKQAVTGSGTVNQTGIIEASITRSEGLVYQCKFTVPTSGNSYFGFHTAASLATSIAGVRISTTAVYAVVGSAQIEVIASGGVTVSSEYTLSLVLGAAGYSLYIKGGTEFSSDTLIYVDKTDSTSTLYPQNQNVSAVQTLTDDYLIPETLYPSLVAQDLEDTFTESSDTLIEDHTPDSGSYTYTALGGELKVIASEDKVKGTSVSVRENEAVVDYGETEAYITALITYDSNVNIHSAVIVRYADTTHRARVRVTNNLIKIDENTGSGSSVVVTSASLGLSDATEYMLQVFVKGSTIRVVCNNLVVEYTSAAEPAGGTKHGVTLITDITYNALDGRIDNLNIYPVTREIVI